MDFEDMEKKIVDNKIHTAIFCSPHNPSGRVWERWEIEKAMEIYEKHDVYVIADEICLTLFLVTTSTFRHSQYPNMLKCIQLHFMHHPKHLTLQD